MICEGFLFGVVGLVVRFSYPSSIYLLDHANHSARAYLFTKNLVR